MYCLSKALLWKVCKERSTGIHVSMKDWDACRECLKASAPDAVRINATLIGIKSELDNRLLSYGKVITLDVLSHIIDGGDPAAESESGLKSGLKRTPAQIIGILKITQTASYEDIAGQLGKARSTIAKQMGNLQKAA